VFLLLIFFMISTTFSKETTLKINLPEATGEKLAQQPASIEVLVGEASQYAIISEQGGSARALINSNRETLVKALSEYSQNENLLLIIRADKKATHDAVIKVLDVAQQLGLSNITFATKQVTN
jgi:biopolymer transport protein ExbD